MERWRDRIFDAIDRGYAYIIDKVGFEFILEFEWNPYSYFKWVLFSQETGEEKMKIIDEETGIDELGNTIEAVEKLSLNYKYYGDMHNKGHLFFSYVHDPDYRFRVNINIKIYFSL